MEKKYEFSEKTLEVVDHILHRIKAIRSFSDVKKGDLGGWVEKESNLSHDGNCWIYNDAKAFNNAKVYGDAVIYNEAIIHGSAHVYDNMRAFDGVNISGNARVYGNAVLSGNAVIGDRAEVYGNAEVCGEAKVCGNAEVYGNVEVYDDAEVCGEAKVYGEAKVGGNAIVEKKSDYIVFKNWWSSGRYFTWTHSNDMWIVGCFYGTGEELIKKAYNDSEEKGREYERVVKYIESIKSEIK